MTDSQINVRSATPADLEIVARFNCALAAETEAKCLDIDTVRAGVRKALESESLGLYFMAELDGAVAGQTMITYEWSDWRDALIWWIQSVYVDPAFRRLGVYRALYDHIRGAAKARPEVCCIRLYAMRNNATALDAYRRLGMSVTDYVVCEEEW